MYILSLYIALSNLAYRLIFAFWVRPGQGNSIYIVTYNLYCFWNENSSRHIHRLKLHHCSQLRFLLLSQFLFYHHLLFVIYIFFRHNFCFWFSLQCQLLFYLYFTSLLNKMSIGITIHIACDCYSYNLTPMEASSTRRKKGVNFGRMQSYLESGVMYMKFDYFTSCLSIMFDSVFGLIQGRGGGGN